jgi:hypothetical protein
MKRLILLSFVQLFISLRVSCKAEIPFSRLNMNENTNPISGNILKIKIGERIFNATLLDNPTTIAFKALLPLTVNMNELNNNEKYALLVSLSSFSVLLGLLPNLQKTNRQSCNSLKTSGNGWQTKTWTNFKNFLTIKQNLST